MTGGGRFGFKMSDMSEVSLVVEQIGVIIDGVDDVVAIEALVAAEVDGGLKPGGGGNFGGSLTKAL